ncbi:MAG: oligosaccharide flippase family protein [Thermoleophilia bacterium]
MNNSRKEVLKHSSYLLMARTFARLASVPFMLYAAAELKPRLFGVFTFVLVSVEMLSSLGDVGLTRYGTRTMVREEVRRERLAGIMLTVQMITSAVLMTVAYTTVLIVSPEAPKRDVILVGLMALFFSSFVFTTDTLFSAAKQFGATAIFQVVGKLVYLGIGFSALFLGYSVVAIMVAFVVSMAVESVLRMIYARLRITRFSRDFTAEEFMVVVRGTAPFAVTGIFTLIYYRADTIILAFLKGDAEVGIYGAAYSFFSFFVWLPIILSRTLLPGLTARNQADLADGTRNSWHWYRSVVIFGIALAYAVTVLAGPAIRILLPVDYNESITALQILIWSIPFMMMVSIGFVTLTINNAEMAGARTTISSAVIIIILDFLLIPPYAVKGAAVAMVLATALYYAQVQWVLSRRVWSPPQGVRRTLAIPLSGLSAMAATGFLVQPLGAIVTLPAGLIVYGGVILIGWHIDKSIFGRGPAGN